MKTNLFFDYYLADKLRNYDVPERLGSVRGEPLGLSLEKYRATFYFVFKVQIKDIAEHLGISYGLLRKWRTEDEFKKVMDINIREYASAVAEVLECGYSDKLTTMVVFYREGLRGGFDKILLNKDGMSDIRE